MSQTKKRTLHRLTAAQVKNSDQRRLNDGGGLWRNRGRAGNISWVFRHSWQGRVRELGIGKYPDVSLAAARRKAELYRGWIAEGIDPKIERAKGQMTFGDACDAYYKKHHRRWGHEKTRLKWKNTFEKTCRRIRDVPVADIDKQHVVSVLEPIWHATPHSAKRARGRIEKVLSYASAMDWRSDSNPARWSGYLEEIMDAHTDAQKAVRHQPSMPYVQVPAFMKTLRTLPAMAARALEFTILTACRTNEVLNATWDEINLGTAIWTIPAERMKMRKAHEVPLSIGALEILHPLHAAPVSRFVFPGQQPGRPLSSMSMLMLLRRLQNEDITVHGFRASFRTWAGNKTDAEREVSEACLAHLWGSDTERAYNRDNMLPKRRRLMEVWCDFCSGIQFEQVIRLHG